MMIMCIRFAHIINKQVIAYTKKKTNYWFEIEL